MRDQPMGAPIKRRGCGADSDVALARHCICPRGAAIDEPRLLCHAAESDNRAEATRAVQQVRAVPARAVCLRWLPGRALDAAHARPARSLLTSASSVFPCVSRAAVPPNRAAPPLRWQHTFTNILSRSAGMRTRPNASKAAWVGTWTGSRDEPHTYTPTLPRNHTKPPTRTL